MPILPAVYAVALYTQAPTGKKPDPAIISVQLRWERQDPAGEPGGKAPAPVLLSGPLLTTTDGQVASIETKSDPKSGANNLFFVSLSPTLESADNSAVASDGTEAKKGATVRMLWSLRVTDGTFPGGVGSVALTGASRLAVGEQTDAVVARFSLADPKTGLFTEYRLSGRTTVGDGAKTAAP
jgi:hypothetical protein